MIVSAFAALVGNGGAPRASIFMGKGAKEKAEKTLGNCFTMQLIVSAVLTAILLLWNRNMLLAFGASDNTIEYAVQYMNIYSIGTVFVQLTLGMNAFITAQGFAKTGMLSVLIGAGINIVLDPIFIFGFGMGVRGAALATILSQACSLSLIHIYLNHETEYGWYLCLDKERIVGGLGVIENDFHDRKDLTPNVCAVYTDKEYRCQGIAGQLLHIVVKDMKSKGITPIYLITDHTSFYERYGWEFLCMVQGDNRCV